MLNINEKPQALLFDLDGTLIDTGAGFKKVFEDLGWEINTFDKLAQYYSGLSLESLMEHLLKDKSSLEKKIDEFQQTYFAHIERYTFFFPGAYELIEKISQQKISWGIISNKDHAQCVKIAQLFQLEPDFLLGSGVIPFKKPHPAPLLKAAQKLKVRPSKCYYFGDMPSDLQASDHALMQGVYCQYGCHHLIDPCYTYPRVCKTIDDIYDLCQLNEPTCSMLSGT